MAQKKIRVDIEAFVKGLKEVRELSGELRRLGSSSASSSAGQQVGVKAGQAAHVKELVIEIHNLSEAVKKLEPGWFRKFFEVLGQTGELLTGLAKLRQAQRSVQAVSQQVRQFAADAGGKVSRGLGVLRGHVDDLAARVPILSGGLGRVLPALAGVGGVTALAAAGVGLLAVGILGLVTGVGALAVALPAGFNLLQTIFGRGVDYNSQLEQTRLGIAAIIASLAELETAGGRKLSGAEALDAGFRLAGAQLEKLKVDAVNTVATFEQIAPAFQAAIGPGVSAGLTLDQVRETTVRIVQAAGALSIPMHQVNQEVRAILEGTINEDARLAKVLGISNEMVRSWKEQGKLAEELNERLAAFGAAGERAAGTLGGLKSNLQEAFNVFSGEATDRAFEALKARMQRLLPQLFDFRNARLDQSFKPLIELIDDIFVRGINLAGDFIQLVVSGVKSISRFVGDNKKTIDLILDSVGRIVATLARVVLHLTGAAQSTETWRNGLDLALGALRTLELVLISVESLAYAAGRAIDFLANKVLTLVPGLREFAQLARIISAASSAGGGLSGAGRSAENLAARPGVTGTRRKPEDGKGGRNRQDQTPGLLRQLRDSELEAERANLEFAFNLFKDHLEREKRLLDEQFGERLVSVRQFYVRQAGIQGLAIDAEIALLRDHVELAKRKRDEEIASIDTKLTAGQRLIAEQTIVNKFEAEYSKLLGQITVKERERLEITTRVPGEIRRATEELQQQFDALNGDLLREQGRGLEAAQREIKRRFEELRKDARTLGGEGLDDNLGAIASLESIALTKARIEDLTATVNRYFEELRTDEVQLAAAVQIGGLSAEQAGNMRLRKQRDIRVEIEEEIIALGRLKQAIEDPAIIASIERITAEWATLGEEVDETARQINDDLETSVKEFGVSAIRNIDGIGDAFRKLINDILDQMARLAVNAIFKQLFGPGDEEGEEGLLGGIFGGASGGGGIGGILSNIFGFAEGGEVSAKPGGRLIQVAEGGFDEVVLTTDPRHRNRTEGLLAKFMRRTGIGPDFGASLSSGLLASLSPAGIPQLAAGGFVSDIPAQAAAGVHIGSVNITGFYETQQGRLTAESERKLKRDAARAVQEGAERAVARRG